MHTHTQVSISFPALSGVPSAKCHGRHPTTNHILTSILRTILRSILRPSLRPILPVLISINILHTSARLCFSNEKNNNPRRLRRTLLVTWGLPELINSFNCSSSQQSRQTGTCCRYMILAVVYHYFLFSGLQLIAAQPALHTPLCIALIVLPCCNCCTSRVFAVLRLSRVCFTFTVPSHGPERS